MSFSISCWHLAICYDHLESWWPPEFLLLPPHSTTVCTILLGESTVAPACVLWLWCWLIHVGDISELNSSDLACGMGKRTFFLHELSTATVERDQGKSILECRKTAQSKQHFGTGMGQFENVSQPGREQSEEFILKNILLFQFPSLLFPFLPFFPVNPGQIWVETQQCVSTFFVQGLLFSVPMVMHALRTGIPLALLSSLS